MEILSIIPIALCNIKVKKKKKNSNFFSLVIEAMNKRYKFMVKAMDHFNLAHNRSQKPTQQY